MTGSTQIPDTNVERAVPYGRAGRLSLIIIAVIVCCAALYLARSFFLPVVLAAIIALTLGPLVQFGKKFQIPSSISAALLVITFGAAVLTAAATLAAPFTDLLTEAPRIGTELKSKLRAFRAPVDSINKVGEEVEKLTDAGGSATSREVVIKGPGLISRAADDVLATGASGALILVLTFFLLVSRDLVFRKVVRISPKLSDKKKALALIKDIEQDVSRYLLTVSIINACLGLVIGGAFYLLGMPSPTLWAVLVMLLNFLPYIGALIGILAAAAVAVITFDTLTIALFPPAVYVLATILEGQFITPTILGRRFSLNTVVILISIAFWGFMWGPIGVLVAVPLLIIVKVLSDRLEPLNWLAEFLSGDDVPADEAGVSVPTDKAKTQPS